MHERQPGGDEIADPDERRACPWQNVVRQVTQNHGVIEAVKQSDAARRLNNAIADHGGRSVDGLLDMNHGGGLVVRNYADLDFGPEIWEPAR